MKHCGHSMKRLVSRWNRQAFRYLENLERRNGQKYPAGCCGVFHWVRSVDRMKAGQKGAAMEQKGIRINKYLSEAGVCSRRKADSYIEAGMIRINDSIAEKGSRVFPADVVYVRDIPVQLPEQKKVIAFYKPRGLVCSTRGQGAETVLDYLNDSLSLYYVGRLDKDSEGLLLLTNDGALANAISKGANGHEKEYEVRVDRPITQEFIRQMGAGVPILDTVTRKCKLTKTGSKTFRIILTQGLNRQIRRMCEYCGYRVRSLKRVRVMNITLEGLEPGAYRELTGKELQELRRLAGQQEQN